MNTQKDIMESQFEEGQYFWKETRKLRLRGPGRRDHRGRREG